MAKVKALCALAALFSVSTYAARLKKGATLERGLMMAKMASTKSRCSGKAMLGGANITECLQVSHELDRKCSQWERRPQMCELFSAEPETMETCEECQKLFDRLEQLENLEGGSLVEAKMNTSVPEDQKVYISVILMDKSNKENYNLQVPTGQCGDMKCEVGGHTCTLRLELDPNLGRRVTTKGCFDCRSAKQELKQLVVTEFQDMIKPRFREDVSNFKASTLADFGGPWKVEPQSSGEHQKWLYKWAVRVSGVQGQIFEYKGCKLNVANGDFPTIGNIQD